MVISTMPSISLDPKDWAKDAAKAVLNIILSTTADGYTAVTKNLIKVIASPPSYSNTPGLPLLYGESTRLASYLSYLLFFLILILSLAFFTHKRLKKALEVYIVVAVSSPFWISAVDYARSFGNQLASSVDFYQPPKGESPFSLPSLGQFGLAFPLIVFCMMAGTSLTMWIAAYDIIIILVKLTGFLTYSLSSMGKRMMQITNWIFAFGLVATIFGKVFAVLILNIGQLMVWTFPFGKTPIGAATYTIGSYFLAWCSQLVLIIACYKGVTEIEGRIAALAKGTMVSTIKQTVKVDINKILRQQQVAPMPVVIMNADGGGSSGGKMSKDDKSAARQRAELALMALSGDEGGAMAKAAEADKEKFSGN